MKQSKKQQFPAMEDNYPSQDIFLIYIVRKKVLIDGELHSITFFKDITFGVLYEQIKAQQQLKNIINNTLYQKIGVPLQSVIRSCKSLESSQQMQVFEQFQSRGSYLRPQLMGIIVTCQQVVLRLKDMQDWSALQNGTFVKK